MPYLKEALSWAILRSSVGQGDESSLAVCTSGASAGLILAAGTVLPAEPPFVDLVGPELQP